MNIAEDGDGTIREVLARSKLGGWSDRLHNYSEGAPAVAIEHVLHPLDGDIVTEGLTEECQLASAELRAELRCFGDRAVVFYELDRSIPNASALGHVAFIASEPRQGGYAFFERPVSAGHPRAITFHLFPRPLGPRDAQGFFSGRLTNRHRIIRRGRPYGPPLVEGALRDDGVDR